MNPGDINLAKAICGYCASALFAIVAVVSLGLVQSLDEQEAAEARAHILSITQHREAAK